MEIGRWYDPISEQWIVPPETSSKPHLSATDDEKSTPAEKAKELRRIEAQRIWEAILDCC
jgi:hypothetical protein